MSECELIKKLDKCMLERKKGVFKTFAKSLNGCSLVNINARDGTLPLWNRSSSHDLGVKSIKILNKIRINISFYALSFVQKSAKTQPTLKRWGFSTSTWPSKQTHLLRHEVML